VVQPIVVEAGRRRTFASALEWPGWCRAAPDEAAALDALTAYATRYAPVALGAGLDWPAEGPLEVVERLPGNATTDFGAPDGIATAEREVPVTAEAERLARVVESAWQVFDEVVAETPEVLSKGPRGGGRDRTPMVAHVLGAEVAYARMLGLVVREPDPSDTAAIASTRQAILEVLRSGSPRPAQRRTWPVPYAARRIAWHVLDHAWEMEERRA
jgi:hypothetical protein